MASLRRKSNSKFWYACWTDQTGRQRQQSTKLTDRKQAVQLADRLESIYRKRTSANRVRHLLANAVRELSGEEIGGETVGGFLKRWRQRKITEVSEGSAARYRQVTESFLRHLGDKADRLWVDEVTPQHISSWRDAQAAIVSPATVNLELKIIRSALGDAVREQVATANVGALVPKLKLGHQKHGRRPFKLPELQKLLAVCDDEWQGMVLFGLYTGARLGDLARLTWQQIDFGREELSLVTQKTGRIVQVPLAPPLVRWLSNRAGDDPAEPLFPRAADIAGKRGRMGDLSNLFHDLLVAAGLAVERTHKRTKKGRHARRAPSVISFHSLRHTATSLLKNAGVSDVIARDIIGHESAAVSRVYTHISDDAKRAAVAKLPDITI